MEPDLDPYQTVTDPQRWAEKRFLYASQKYCSYCKKSRCTMFVVFSNQVKIYLLGIYLDQNRHSLQLKN